MGQNLSQNDIDDFLGYRMLNTDTLSLRYIRNILFPIIIGVNYVILYNLFSEQPEMIEIGRSPIIDGI